MGEQEDKSLTSLIDIERFSLLSTLYNVTALVFRFLNNLRGSIVKGTLRNHKILREEYCRTREFWIKTVQGESFEHEIKFLRAPDEKPPNLVTQLGIFLKDDIIRCHGRLENANLPYDTRYPVLLPRGHHYTRLLVLKCHNDIFHLGVSAVVNKLREIWWIPRLRQTVKAILRNCIICQKIQGLRYQTPPPPSLPSTRVENVKPFHSISIDYTGAIQYRTKNKVSRKAYVCLFTCAVTRGVHLELVDDNTAQGFLYAFRKFAARRSYPKYIYSDNALNFRTVAPFLKDILSHQFMNEHNCKWKFI